MLESDISALASPLRLNTTTTTTTTTNNNNNNNWKAFPFK